MTLKQEALARAIADGATSVTEAAQIAGYAHRQTASLMLRNASVANQVELLKAKKLDRARDLASRARRSMEKGLDLLESAVYCPHCKQSPASPTDLIASGAVVLKSIPPEDLEQHELDPRALVAQQLDRAQHRMIGLYIAARTIRPMRHVQLEQIIGAAQQNVATLRLLLRPEPQHVVLSPTK